MNLASRGPGAAPAAVAQRISDEQKLEQNLDYNVAVFFNMMRISGDAIKKHFQTNRDDAVKDLAGEIVGYLSSASDAQERNTRAELLMQYATRENDPQIAKHLFNLLNVALRENSHGIDAQIDAVRMEAEQQVLALDAQKGRNEKLSAALTEKSEAIDRKEAAAQVEKSWEEEIAGYYKFLEAAEPEKQKSTFEWVVEEIVGGLVKYCKDDDARWEAQLSEICRMANDHSKMRVLLGVLEAINPSEPIAAKVVDKCMACRFSDERELVGFIRTGVSVKSGIAAERALNRVPEINDINSRAGLLLELSNLPDRAISGLCRDYLLGMVEDVGKGRIRMEYMNEVKLYSALAISADGDVAMASFRELAGQKELPEVFDEIAKALGSAKSFAVRMAALEIIRERKGMDTARLLYGIALGAGDERLRKGAVKAIGTAGADHFETMELLHSIATKRGNGAGFAAIEALGEFQINKNQLFAKVQLLDRIIADMGGRSPAYADLAAQQITKAGSEFRMNISKDPNLTMPAAAIIGSRTNDDGVAYDILKYMAEAYGREDQKHLLSENKEFVRGLLPGMIKAQETRNRAIKDKLEREAAEKIVGQAKKLQNALRK